MVNRQMTDDQDRLWPGTCSYRASHWGKATAHWTLQKVADPTLLLKDCRRSHKKARCERLKEKEPFLGNKEIKFQSIKTKSLGQKLEELSDTSNVQCGLFPPEERGKNARPLLWPFRNTLWVLCVWLCMSIPFCTALTGAALDWCTQLIC